MLRKTTLILISSLLFLACGKKEQTKQPSTENEIYRVFVTINPLKSIADSISGDLAEVHVLIPPGADPHTYEPTPQDIRRLSDSAVLFTIGMGLDDWASKLALAAEDGPRIVPVSVGVPKLPAVPERYLERLHQENKSPSQGNPHIWLDPYIISDLVIPIMVRAFVAADPPNAGKYRANADRISNQLKLSGEDIGKKLAPLSNKSILADHGAFAYFCRRYNIKMVDVLEPFPGQEPTPTLISDIIKNAQGDNPVGIMVEPMVSSKPAEVVSNELNIPIIHVDPLGQQGEGYIELMERNTKAIIDATR